MKKRILLLISLLAALLLSGCGMRTVEDMYAIPKRSEEYDQLQSAIDNAMQGLTYSAPQSGENQQTVQMADLDGDGVDEYLVFAAGVVNKPLQVLVFRQNLDGSYCLMETIESSGSAFEQVEYVDFDERPGFELVIGCKVSDQVLRSVSVYSFSQGEAELMLMIRYSKFLTCDLDKNGRGELMVLRPGEEESERGMAVLYSCTGGTIERSVETELSQDPSNIRRITPGYLQGNTPAIFVASAADENAIVTDIYAIKDGQFTNISYSGDAAISIRTLRNYYVYAEDIDDDGVLELPGLITMKSITEWTDEEQKFLLRWFSLDVDGWEFDKIYTFHNFTDGWYMRLDNAWAGRVTVDQESNAYHFYIWDESYQNATALFSMYVYTGPNKDEAAVENGRFVLHRTESTVYAARLKPTALEYDITEEYLTECFRLIRQDWRTGETWEVRNEKSSDYGR